MQCIAIFYTPIKNHYLLIRINSVLCLLQKSASIGVSLRTKNHIPH